MNKEEKYFHDVGASVDGALSGKLFGKLCFKINKKAFCCFFEDEMVFKLNGDFHKKALTLNGSQLFDPSKKGRPMKEWVQVPFEHHKHWKKFATAAAEYVGG